MILKYAALILGTLMIPPPTHDPLPDLRIGDALPAPDVKMKNVTGGEAALKSLNGKNGLLVIFSCNTCPFVIGSSDGSEGWEGRYPELGRFCQEKGIGLALVNSNEAKREVGDGFADMQLRYRAKRYTGAYLLDEGSKVADAFGARTTPHVFLFNNDLKLMYKGAIDDNVESAAGVKERWLQDAITNLTAGKPIDPATTRNIGCSIKRVAVAH